jgi:hypothetical protein
MYTRELLLIAGILLLVFLGRREHLSFTDTIKDIRRSVDQAEQDRIFALAPTSLQQASQAVGGKPTVAMIVQDFQGRVYVPATAPITEEVVNNYVAQTLTRLQSREDAEGVFFRNAYSNGDTKRLLMSYMGLTPTAATTPISNRPAASMSVPQVLEQMRDNLLEYKMTGKSEYKSVYEGTKAWLDQYIANLSTQLNLESDAITSEVDTYRSANTEMAQVQSDFQRVKTDGPALENTYLTLKKQMDQVPGPDTTGLYVKGGIAVGLIAGALALTFF